MNDELKDKWAEAAKTNKPIPVGGIVVCDVCSEDYTLSKESGGFIFGSSGYCPKCAVRGLQTIRGYGEEGHIRAYCPVGKSFADFIREYRGDDAVIQIQTFPKHP